MKIARILSVWVVVLLIGGPPAGAQGFSPGRPNPYGKQDRQEERRTVAHVDANSRAYEAAPTAPSPLERFNAGTRKFFADTGAGTKGFFGRADAQTKIFLAKTRNALTWKKPAAKKKKPKRSWLDSLLGREEPKPIESLDDWWELKRMDP